ncbi:hypothetical protein [Lewinella sp. 4G2]|uniref:hypothetical protein n=1 Tax=Lewinella sp. 4G2 TaxID=1803372 RepID=UPI0012F73CAD|nr:hypothetical protein [Lewinella sp. 4G2]
MRFLTLCLLALCLSTCASAQVKQPALLVDAAPVVDTLMLLTTPAWEEEKGSLHPGYLLSLTDDLNFAEDAVKESARKYRHLLGRWKKEGIALTLSVDGFMGEGLVHPRYKRGRDFYIVYDIVAVNEEHLILKDQRTGKQRKYRATDKSAVQDQSELRKPKGKKDTKWTLPDLNNR